MNNSCDESTDSDYSSCDESDYSSEDSSYDSEPDYIKKEYEEPMFDNKGWMIVGWKWVTLADYGSPVMECQYCKRPMRYVHRIVHPENKFHSMAYVGCGCARKLCENQVYCPCRQNRVTKHGPLCKDFSEFDSYAKRAF